MDNTPEVMFTKLDIIKMIVKLTGWEILKARIAYEAFIRYLGLPADSQVGANTLPLLIRFMGLFTRNILTITDYGMGNVVIEYCDTPKVQDMDITRLMGGN